MPLTDAQWDDLMAQLERAGKKPAPPPKSDATRRPSSSFLDNLIRRFKRKA